MPEADPITIGVTCYNAEASIARALASAQAQQWPNLEILVIDDGSSDRSAELIEKFARSDPRVRLVRHGTNRGFPTALNTIIENATGRYIAFFDDDDESEPDRVSQQYRRLSDFAGCASGAPVICYTGRRVFRDGIETCTVDAVGRKSPEPRGAMVVDHLLLLRRPPRYVWGAFGSGTMMAHRDTLARFGFDPKFRRSAEWDFAVRVAQEGGWFISVNAPLLKQNVTMSADKTNEKQLHFNLMLRHKHKDYLRRRGAYFAALQITRAQFYFSKGNRVRGFAHLLAANILAPHIILKDAVQKRLI